MINYNTFEKVGEYRNGFLNWFTPKEKSVVYLNSIDSDFYIGSTKDLHRRFHQYVSSLTRNKYCSSKVQEKFNSSKSMDIYILERVKESVNLKSREQFYIDKYSPTLNTTNPYSWKNVNCSDFERFLLNEHRISLSSFCKKHKIKPLDIKNAYRTMKKFSVYTNVPMWQLFASPDEVCPVSGEVNGYVKVKGTLYEVHSFEDLRKLLELNV